MRIRWRVGRNLSLKVRRGRRGSPQEEGRYREDKERKEYEKGKKNEKREKQANGGWYTNFWFPQK